MKPILLETTKATWSHCIWLFRITGKLHLDMPYNDKPKSIEPFDSNMTPQHIYIIDKNAEIKEGDWIYHTLDSYLSQVTDTPQYEDLDKIKGYGYSKIIASTDHSLGKYIDGTNKLVGEFIGVRLPFLSEQSIKLLIDYYNKNDKMPENIEIEIINKIHNQYSDANAQWEEETVKLNSEGKVDITIPEDRFVNIKTAEEYLKDVNLFTQREDLYKIGKQMQLDMLEYAVNKCLSNAEIEDEYDDEGNYLCSGNIVKEYSILKTIDEVKKEMNG